MTQTGTTISRRVISENMAGADRRKVFCLKCNLHFMPLKTSEIEGYTYTTWFCTGCEINIQTSEGWGVDL